MLFAVSDSKKLELQPEHLKWSPSGGMQSVTIVNNTGERQAIKVKCSDNLVSSGGSAPDF